MTRVPGCRQGPRVGRRSPEGVRRKEDADTAPPTKKPALWKGRFFEPCPPDACDNRGARRKGGSGGKGGGGSGETAGRGLAVMPGCAGARGQGKPSLPTRSEERAELGARLERTARKGHVRKQGPGARTRGRRRHRRKLRRMRRRSPAVCQSRRGDRIRAPRLPRGSRWGRRREGCRTERRRRAGRYRWTARCPAAPAADATDEARPSKGFRGKIPLPQEGLPDGSLRPEGQAGPTAARGARTG